ncbi:hypothetical protein [Halosimplex salinum]|uniref:hypothetical protein n=1 Tax=Halosimplex salinum TaxID=1710538 RepID=UPI000F463201|nr:hypothetical protein [Halosimplex salinum]
MVEVVKEKRLSEIRSQKSSRRFPGDEYQKIISSLEQVPESTLNEDFDGLVAESLPEYEYEWDAKSGRNPKTMLWHPEFNHSVDLYHPEKRIAVEVEKAQRKRISDDILKFIRGGKTRDGGRDVIEFGCLIVPAEHPEYGNLFQHSITTLEFMRSVLHVEDIAVIGYRA